MTVKSNKSFAKRLKVSKNGKIKARVPGHNHFNSKESGRSQLAKKRQVDFHMSSQEKRRFLAHL
ncbi:MAG: bL35 family ribosomal protein [Patescibacteria group bacterium]|jgi:ribosomal protein L35